MTKGKAFRQHRPTYLQQENYLIFLLCLIKLLEFAIAVDICQHLMHYVNDENKYLTLSEVCRDIEIEPQLQPLPGENMSLQSANTEDSA